MLLKEKFASILPGMRENIKALLSKYGEEKISEVTVAQAFGGMRGVKGMLCETSYVDPFKGLIIRGHPLSELTSKYAEEIMYMLLIGEEPTKEQFQELKEDFSSRSQVPDYVWDTLRALDPETHPMTMFNLGILAMQRESIFAKRYSEGISKMDYWEPILEDAVNLIAKLPTLAAGVYRIRFNKGEILECDENIDMGAKFAKLTGLPDPNGEFSDLMRLYFNLHCDHEGGNASAFTTHCIGSTLSDSYYSLSGGLNALAGPLHGLANQECLKFVQEIIAKYNGVPTKEQLTEYAWEVLNSHRVIPGYGHAVLRATDPRFTAFIAFGKEFCADDATFKTVNLMFENIPDILTEHGKAKSVWPNVDAASGALLHHYGLTEATFYTVLFGVSRAMGVLSQQIINRALGVPITRPKSVTSKWIMEELGK